MSILFLLALFEAVLEGIGCPWRVVDCEHLNRLLELLRPLLIEKARNPF